MGDTPEQNESLPVETPTDSAGCDLPKPSMDILKEVKPSENIAMDVSKPDASPEEQPTSVSVTLETVVKSEENTTPQPLSDKSVKKDDDNVDDSIIKQKERTSILNRSDIFSVNDKKNLASTIFSVGGAPSKTIHMNDNTTSGQVASEVSSETLQGSKQSQLRNPVTGIGVSSNDEYKGKPSKRKDGNPVLGVGYKEEDFCHNPNSQRIPPGGYSQGLW